jgi:hypothetical protein
VKATFNGQCSRCGAFRSDCATVYRRLPQKGSTYTASPTTLCPECRKKCRGSYRLDEKHR